MTALRGSSSEIEFIIKMELKAAGFDMSKPIIRFVEELTMDVVYRQEEG